MCVAKIISRFVVVAALVFVSDYACADIFPILNFSAASGTNDGFSSTGGTAGTTDDGDTSTVGNQTSPILFQNFLSPLADFSAGSVTISGVMLDSNAAVLPGSANMLFSTTTGGQISFFDDNDVLLLSGDLGQHVLLGASSGNPFASGSFISSGADDGITFTGGTLFPLLVANSGELSINLSNIQTSGTPGLTLSGSDFLDFTSNATGQISACHSDVPVTTGVPEPSTLPMLVFGVAVLSATRRRSNV